MKTEAAAPQLMTLERISLPDLQDRLNYFARQSVHLCGYVLDAQGNQIPAGQAVAKFFKEFTADLGDAKKIAERNEFLARAEKDPEARLALCAIRLETYNNFVMARLDWISWYAQIVTLGDKERPMEQNTTQMEVNCYYISQDGNVEMVRIRRDDVETLIPLRIITTPAVRMKEWDIYRGNVVDAALQVLNLANDLANKMEFEFFKMIKASAFGTFTFTGKTATYPYVTSKYINKANLPTTNEVTVTGAGAATFFDFPVLDDIIDYAARWQGITASGDLRPTGRIRVPALHLRKFGSGITPTGAMMNSTSEQLLENGWTGVGYRRINWTFIPDNTLDPAEPYAYPEFNIKPARVYLKPSGDKEVIRTGDQDYQLSQKNEQERWMRKVYGASLNGVGRMAIARFKYTI